MKYKILFVPQMTGEAQFERYYDTLIEASRALEAISIYTLMLHECSLMPDYSNYGAVLELDDDGEWVEVDA